MTLGQAEIEENVIGSSTYSYVEPEHFREDHVEGLRPIIEILQQEQPIIDTTIGPISLNFDESSCLETDQIPQNFRQSLRSLPDESHLPPPESQSSMMKKNVVPEKKQAVKKYSCPDCPKTYTQSHNLEDHQRKNIIFDLILICNL